MSVVKYKIIATERGLAAGLSETSDKVVLKSTPDIVRPRRLSTQHITCRYAFCLCSGR